MDLEEYFNSPRPIKTGQRFRYIGYGSHAEYILAISSYSAATLISLADGNRFCEPVEIIGLSVSYIFTQEDMRKLIGQSSFDEWEML